MKKAVQIAVLALAAAAFFHPVQASASSARMCTDFTAFLFDEKQLQGTKQGLCGSTYFAGLPFNNKASSGRSQNLLCTYRLFDAANATGSYTALSPGERDNDFSNDTVGNNRVSSVQKVC